MLSANPERNCLNFDITVLNVGAVLSRNNVPVCISMSLQQVLN